MRQTDLNMRAFSLSLSLSLPCVTITPFLVTNTPKKSVHLFHFFPTAHATLNTDGASARNGPHSSKWREDGRSTRR